MFNRPGLTKQVFEQIKKQQPSKLFVAADGPRSDHATDRESCAATRAIIADNIDWPCELKTLYRQENLGCGRAVSEAITWFFDHVEQGIILEDDCLPAQSFFCFCEELLNKYKDDENILAINGCNFNYSGEIEKDYFSSRFINPWGWATWRRAAKTIDYDISSWHRMNKMYFLWKTLRAHLFDFDLDWYHYWKSNFNAIASAKLDTWDYQWQFAQLVTGSKTLVSSKNLVKNLGFNLDATHTTLTGHPSGHLVIDEFNLPIKINAIEKANIDFEEQTIKPICHLYKRKQNSFYLKNWFLKCIPSLLKVKKLIN